MYLIWGLLIVCLNFSCGSAAVPVSSVDADATRFPQVNLNGSNDTFGPVDISLKNADGQTESLADYVGSKTVVLSFWAPCCECSRQIMIDAQKLYVQYADQNMVYVGIAVTEPKTVSQVSVLRSQRGLTFPILLDQESTVVSQLNPRRNLPYTIIFDRTGNSVWEHDGYVPGDDVLIEDRLKKVLGDNPATED